MTEEKQRTNPFLSKTVGKTDTKSRGKADAAAERADTEIKRTQENAPVQLPLNSSGKPMILAEMSAAELVPTGNYANVSIGPCRIHFAIDPDRALRDDENYFSPAQRATIIKALNEAAEIVEADVVAVQRNIVLESLQGQQGS